MKSIHHYLAAFAIGLGLSACTPPPPEGPDDICHSVVDYHIGGNALAGVPLEEGGTVTLIFQTWDSVFAKVVYWGCEILDASGNGYPDALTEGSEIGPEANWVDMEGLLCTPEGQGGQFQGAGIRYLGFRIPAPDNGYKYGWIKLDGGQAGEQLYIFDFAIHQIADQPITAGQTDSGQHCSSFPPGLVKNVHDIIGSYNDSSDPEESECYIEIRESDDPDFDFVYEHYPPWELPQKIYGKIVNGRLVVPWTTRSGYNSSPPLFYYSSLCGYGELGMNGQQVYIVWRFDYDQKVFAPESYHRHEAIYKCD